MTAYRAAEHSAHILYPTTTSFDFFAKIGWAYDLKTTSQKLIKKRTVRTGCDNHIWGWDKDQTKDDTEGAKIKNKIQNKVLNDRKEERRNEINM
ncbi:hypothetical protein WA026_009199 [Henosepilachna vigintioctopunctata]|uniref:Uncharacterized protein n=1 Tax=Henosepilachna vigintioctopunctata TaxID=420089 RepID=A0AAW1UVQ0_9CUCU